MIADPEAFLRGLFDLAVKVADPMQSLAAHLPPRPKGRVLVIGAGKASARMAEAVEAVWGPCNGLVITRYGYGRPCKGIEIVEASHPVPDLSGQVATARMLEMLAGLKTDDYVLALISGGASALLVAPCAGITLADKQAVNAGLLASGAPIGKINIVRKHLSRVKGGQLAAAAYPARMFALMISDVPGDDPGLIGSGPTVGEVTSPADAREILDQWQVPVSEPVRRALANGSTVVAPADPRLSRITNHIFAAPAQSLAAAADMARGEGCLVHLLGDAIEGEARAVAAHQAAEAIRIKSVLCKGDAPVLLLSGGELTVTRRGAGIGGPNAEFCLALAIELQGASGIYGLACDTDGVDGAADIAGAFVHPGTLDAAQKSGLVAVESLDRNDAHTFFAAIENQVVTGPTLTNVNDFRAILITGDAPCK